ncbi:MAG: c-type cytochrome, partial [Lentisphaeraceae bacterium]|nr:c-type cytochrome [Lentisphaeraceae bacterium]
QVDDKNVKAIYWQVPAGQLKYSTFVWRGPKQDLAAFIKVVNSNADFDFSTALEGSQARWPQIVTTKGVKGDDDSTLTVDEITLPDNNPWRSWMRPGAMDFFADGKRLAVSTWSGDVWVASNLDDLNNLQWKRFAAGLFHPLGLKIVDDKIYVQCRDQISILHDLNNDGEADFYENFNNDVVITKNFHEFSFELQRDKEGNFYFVKGAPVVAGGEGFAPIQKHHGCLFKVSPDGETLEVIATGFRAPNGMGMSPDGQLTVSDNEGDWVATTPINWIEEGGFYGVIPTSQRKEEPKKRSQTLCWIPHEVDNSAGGQVWIPKGDWGDLGGEMLHMSYGQAKLFHVLKEKVDGKVQGGVFDLKPSGGFDAGIMRGRYNKADKGLYLCGLKGWQTKGVKDGGIYRVRYTGKESCRPKSLQAAQNGVKITFTQPLDPASALDAGNYDISRWVYEVSSKYGSRHFHLPKGRDWDSASRWSPLPKEVIEEFNKKTFADDEAKETAQNKLYEKYIGEDAVKIKSISLSDDAKTLHIELDDMRPVMQMKIAFEIKSATKQSVNKQIYHTVHKLGNWKVKAGKAIKSSDLNAPLQGVVVRYRHRGQNKEDIRVQRQASFYIKEKTAITQFLDHGPFDARIEAYLKAPRNMDVELFTAGTGLSSLSINGKVLYKTRTNASFKAVKVSLKKGFNKLNIEYNSPAKGDAAFRLYWQSLAYFPKEPIPAVALFHEGGQDDVMSSQLKRKGLSLALENNCFSCHETKDLNTAIPELHMGKINLSDSAERLNGQWIKAWLQNPRNLRPSARMPQLLKALPENEWEQAATDIAAFMTKAQTAPAKFDGDVAAGKKLYSDLGCASCHATKEDDLEKGKVLLQHAAFKFRPGAMANFLQDPQKYNAASRMPNFNLSEYESQALEAYLRSQLKAPASSKVSGNVQRGQKYFEQLNCSACHDHQDVTKTAQEVASFFGKSGACITSSSHKLPIYKFSDKERQALKAFAANGHSALTHNQPAEFAVRQLQNLNCVNCHSRDNLASLWTSGNTKHQDVPPSLTHVGEKIQPSYLEKILKGDTKKMRPWMAARMPSFKTQASLLSEGLAAMHGFNTDSQEKPEHAVEHGKKLIGQSGGFACIICHDSDSTKALAPFGAPGLNLKLAGERLRYEFFMRWMLNPKRVEPTTHMIQFSSDHKTTGIADFDKKADVQF